MKIKSGGGVLDAVVELSGDELSVRPDVRGSRPYEVDTGPLDEGSSFAINRIDLRGPAAGAANIWTVLSEGARVASLASPKRIQPIRALWRYGVDLKRWIGDYQPSAYEQFNDGSVIHVGGLRSGLKHDEFEAVPLLHEYGHHVLSAIADPGQKAAGAHTFTSVHPDNPALAWSEAFGNAFAAVVLNSPKQTLGCKPVVDLGATPATPLPSNRRYAQYNETALAGALWGVNNHFGGGVKGLKVILRALAAYRRDGHPPQDARDVIDALIEHEPTNTNVRVLLQIFRQEWISWDIQFGASLLVIPPPQSPQTYADTAIKGPYSCDGTDPNKQDEVDGGLPSAIDDNCRAGRHSAAQILFPYLAGGRHRSGEFTGTVSYHCVPLPPNGPCNGAPAQITISLSRHNGVGSPKEVAAGTGSLTFTGKFTLADGATRDVVRFDALGDCKFLITGQDCSV